jgi:hypothetical protein
VAQAYWGILGIKPTSELKAIRSAYASRLKTIDVDADPAAFMALRDAYEAAQDYVRYSVYDDEDDDWFDGDAADHVDSDASAPVFHSADSVDNSNDVQPDPASTSPDIENPWNEPSGEVIYDELVSIVNDEDKYGILLTSEEYTKAEALTRQFVGWMDRVTIDEARDYELSAAYLMAHTIPRSDPMLEIIPAYFGWDNNADQYDRPEQIGIVLERRDSNRAYAMLQDPNHRLHNAFTALTSTTETKRRGRKLRKDVRELLTSASQHHPSLMSVFYDNRVREWERTLRIVDNNSANAGNDYGKEKSSDGFKWWWVVLIIVALGRILSGISSDTNGSDPNPPYTVVRSQLDTQQMLNDIFDNQITVEQVDAKNKDFGTFLLKQKIDSEGSGYNQEVYVRKMRDLFTARLKLAVRKASSGELSQYWRLNADKAEYLLKTAPSTCLTFLRRDNELYSFSDQIKQTERKLMGNILLNYNPDTTVIGTTKELEVSGDIVAKTIKASKLPEDTVRKAMQGKATDIDTCRMRIALYRTLADFNTPDAIKLMRNLE